LLNLLAQIHFLMEKELKVVQDLINSYSLSFLLHFLQPLPNKMRQRIR